MVRLHAYCRNVDEERTPWHEQRRRAVAEHGAALRRRQAAESAQARRLVAAFTTEARLRGLPITALTAQAYNGRGRYRTGLRGWYLKPDRSVAVSEDGGFYILTVPASLRARLTGVELVPAEPRLVIGEGARDGESIPLETLLRQRLDQP
jgi:hypothetical protein